MTTATKTKTHKKNRAATGKRNAFINANKNMRLLGEVICWNVGAKSHAFKDVVQALKDAELNDKAARELLPRYAFTRAMKHLKEERVIDPLNDEGDVQKFQLTQRLMKEGQWEYSPETVLELNTITGKVTCANKKVEAFAQAKLNECIEVRTSTDITKIIQKLFDNETDLFPIKDAGGVYFVPDAFVLFSDKVEKFVGTLGGALIRFPVPADTKQGDKNVGNAIANGLDAIVDDHRQAIADFGLNTQHGTLERAAEKIKETRVKVEAYASYLDDRKQELLDALTEANRELLGKVQHLSDERAKAPITQTENGSTRAFIFGHPVTAVIRWMGKAGWKQAEAKAVVADILGEGEIADGTVAAQLGAGRNGQRGDPANLTEEQVEQLNDKVEAIRKAAKK